LLLCFPIPFASWECDEAFDAMVVKVAREQQCPVQWVDFMGNPREVSGGMVANAQLASIVGNVTQGRAVGHVEDIFSCCGCHRAMAGPE
jgi:hypothetical protein